MKIHFTHLIQKATILIIFLAAIVTTQTFAGIVDTSTAKTVAKNFFYEMASSKRVLDYSTLQLTLAQSRVENSDTIYYVYNITSGGWIIVSAESNVVPILAYNLQGSYSNVDPPPAFVEWMSNYKDQILFVKQNNIRADSSIANKWANYSNVSNARISSIQSVGPLLTTTWDQSPYYNNLCPGGSVTGCVATAMGQIMRYWGYDYGLYFPSQGIGSHTDNDANTISNYGYLTANFCSANYDWANMPATLSSGSTQAQKNAISTLLYHCGISVDMEYSPTESGTQTSYVPNALINYFGYSSSATYYDESTYSGDWQALLTSELDAQRPIEYCGIDYTQSPVAGHAFVCDGYSTTDYFHFNWGWGSSSYNSYCYLNSLIPNSSSYNFASDQGAVVYIVPGAYMAMNSNFSLTPNPIVQGQSLSVSVTLRDDGVEDYSGDLYLGLFDQYDNLIEIIETINGVNQIAQTYSTYNFSTNNITATPGNYNLKVFYSNNGCWILAPETAYQYSNPFPVQVIANQPITANFSATPTTICIGNTVNFTDLTTGNPTSWAWNFGDGNTSTSSNPSHVYSTAGTFTVSLTVSNGTNNDSYSINNLITVNSVPSIAATPTGTTSLCPNPANTNYTTNGATNATSYVWSISPSGAGTINGTGTTSIVDWNNTYTGTASISVYGVNNCGIGTWSNALSVTINSLPPQPIITVNGSILTSTAASIYQWYYNGNIITGATSQSYTATQNGSYYVVVTNSSGCSNTSAAYSYNTTSALPFVPELYSTAGDYFVNGNFALEWSIGESIIETNTGTNNTITQGFHQNRYVITSINEIADDNYSITVYPNPTSDNITIDFLIKNTETLKLKLIDAQGKLLINDKIKSEEKTKTLNLQNISKGIYLLNFYNVHGKLIKSFKIEKIN